MAQNCARARLLSTSSSQIRAPHVDKYLLRDGNVIGQLEALLCDVGSRVHEDEETAVIETDKVAISVRAPESGVVTAVLKGLFNQCKSKTGHMAVSLVCLLCKCATHVQQELYVATGRVSGLDCLIPRTFLTLVFRCPSLRLPTTRRWSR